MDYPRKPRDSDVWNLSHPSHSGSIHQNWSICRTVPSQTGNQFSMQLDFKITQNNKITRNSTRCETRQLATLRGINRARYNINLPDQYLILQSKTFHCLCMAVPFFPPNWPSKTLPPKTLIIDLNDLTRMLRVVEWRVQPPWMNLDGCIANSFIVSGAAWNLQHGECQWVHW